MNKPWEKWGMTETEWREYEDEYADYLDITQFQPTTLKDKIAVQNALERAKHNRRREEALNKIRAMRTNMKKEPKDGVSFN